jgi:hypothetical protein
MGKRDAENAARREVGGILKRFPGGRSCRIDRSPVEVDRQGDFETSVSRGADGYDVEIRNEEGRHERNRWI